MATPRRAPTTTRRASASSSGSASSPMGRWRARTSRPICSYYEKSRVVFQPRDERCYHVPYTCCTGLTLLTMSIALSLRWVTLPRRLAQLSHPRALPASGRRGGRGAVRAAAARVALLVRAAARRLFLQPRMGYGWGDDKLEYMVMRDAMTTVGITEPDQIDAMRVLAAALHLGRTSPL